MISRRFKLAAASGGVVGAMIVAAFGPVVRWGAGRAVAKYAANVDVEQVAPAAVGVRLYGVDLSFEDMPALKVHADEVLVRYGLSGRTVTVRGGILSAVGAREAVVRQVEAFRARHLAGGSGDGGSGAGRGLDLSGLRVQWQDAAERPTESASASDIRVTRAGGQLTIAAAEASAMMGRTTLGVKNGRVELTRRGEGGGYRLAGLSADAVEAELTIAKNGSLGGLGAKVAKGEGEDRRDRAASGAALRRDLVIAAMTVNDWLDPSADVRLGGVHARIHHAGEVLNLGPGTLQIRRSEGRLLVELSPELRGAAPKPAVSVVPAGTVSPAPPGAEEALTFRLAVPLSEAGPPASQEIVADVQGGPIWLSSIGVREGDFGLFDVGNTSLSTRSHLVLSADGRTLRIDGEGKVHALSVRSAALSDEPVAGLALSFALKGEVDLDGSRARIAEGELDLGAIRLVLKGDYDRSRSGGGESYRVRGSFDMPLTACQSMLDSTPKGLIPKLQGMRMAGSFALRGSADIDTAHLDRGFRLNWDATSSCRVTEAPAAVSVERFKGPFRRTAYDGQGKPVSIETGPGTADWVPYAGISKFMEAAVLTTEDGGFHRHHGFDHEAIKNSVRENLRRRKFVRGASTISMQLAKNLYLDRGKNLSRKLQEAVLTMYLEQELTKEQIMELYLNVVEFGPMVYGVGPAARHYFSTGAKDLSLGQALYIASIMPNPKVQHFGSGGAVSPSWMAYLQKLMKIARDRSRVTDEEMEEGLRETVIRGAPAPQRGSRPATTGPIDPDAPAALPYEPVEEWP